MKQQLLQETFHYYGTQTRRNQVTSTNFKFFTTLEIVMDGYTAVEVIWMNSQLDLEIMICEKQFWVGDRNFFKLDWRDETENKNE